MNRGGNIALFICRHSTRRWSPLRVEVLPCAGFR